jgi:hypothetical protein
MIRILLLLPFFFACSQKSDKSDVAKLKSNTTYVTVPNNNTVDTNLKTTHEYLDWNTLKINNQLSLLCKQKEIIALLGQPDSIVIPKMNNICVSYFEKKFKYLFFGESQFESKGETTVISSISFDHTNRIWLQTGNIVLDNSMTIDKLNSIFPKAVKQSEEVYLEVIGNAICVRLGISKVASEDAWLLFFQNGKLIRIDFWMPC